MNCALCGCSDQDACVDLLTGQACQWIAPELCSFCEFTPLGFRPPTRAERGLPDHQTVMLVIE